LTIGGGGRGGYGAWDRSASSGSSSIFGTLEAYGGGAGADEYDTGANGGSGGGAGGGNSSATFGSATQSTGSGTKYGSNGGAKSGLANAYGGGGGGGVNGAGGAASSTTGGTGGNGITIYGYTLGGGGGGGVNTSTGAGSATAGGGAGGNNSGTPQSGGNGTAGTGGGGGGGANNGAVFGGDGGSGVIIILYTTNLTLTFNSNYGTPTTSTQTIPSNTATNLTANSFTRTGYIFSSWNTLANGSGTSYQNTSSISISTNTTLYAQWRQSFLITTSAGTYSEIDASPSVASGDSVTVNFGVNPSYSTGFSLTSVVVDGVALTGSALTTAISNGSYTFLNVTTTHTISVEETGNTFSITYKAGSSGTGSDDVQSFIYGSVPTYKTGAATGITRSGYTVLYWDETDGGVGGVRAPGGSYYSPANLILYPVWRANTNNAITYDNQGATTSHSGGSITYTTATNISTIPTTAPIKTGFTFAGWYTAASGGTRVTNNSYRPPSPYGAITLYAQWTGDALTPSLGTPSPTADGFTVSVTNFDGNFTYSFTLTNGASAAIDANGLITVSNLTAGSSSALTVTTSRSGYTSGVGSVTGSTLAVFTVTFLANNGSGSMSPQSSQVSTILNSNSFTRTKYNFVSWNTSADGSGTTYLDGANFNFSSNISLYATWIAIPTITSQPNSVSKDAGDSASFSVTTTAVDGGTLSYQWQKDGLNILGANSDNLTINSISSGSAGDYQVIITNTKNGNTSTITSNVAVLTVTIPTYSVTYSAPDAGSGSVPTDSSSPYTYNSTVTLLGNTGSLTRTGYVFTGWRTAADATLRLGGSSYQITFDTTFIAVWTRIYQLTLDSNGGSGTMSALDGPSVTIPNNTFTRSGYTFKEWNSASNGTGDIFTVNLTLTLTQAVKLYAIWNAVPSNVITFNTISSQTYGQTLDLSSYVSASSGLTVTATSNTTQICTISGLTLTAIGAGTCSITASQPGDGSNAAASNVTRSFTVNKKSLTISVGDISANFGSTISNPTYTQSGLVSSLGDVIATPTYYYSGTSSTYYGRSTTKPTAVGSYLISMLSLSLSSGSTANYQVSFVSGNLSIASVASSNVSGITLKRTTGDTSSNLITNFDNSRTSYSVYVAADVSAVVASITRPNGTVSSAQVKINDSGWRKLTFKSNEASTGVLPLPSSTNTLKISTISNDKGTKEFTITIYRDTKTAPTGGSAATPAPTTTATPADNAVSSVIFLVNNPSGNSSGLQQVDISPTFSRTTYSYTATFSNIQSATMMKADFTASGVTLKLKINNGAFTSIPNTGYSSTISLNVGSNSAILRVTSSDASSVDYTFTLSRAAALSGLTPTFSSPSAITGGFTVQISNYSNSYNWSVSASNGTAAIDNSGLVTVTGVTGSSTITVISRRSGYTNARSTLTYP
jgi:uncharacterized repeat protein (TIGR02543 family)